MNLFDLVLRTDLEGVADLLGSGAAVNDRGPRGMSALMLSAGRGNAEMTQLLISAGADVLATEPTMGATSLHKAAQAGNAETVRLLLEAGAFIDQQTPTLGNTALMDAVSYRSAEVVALLLRRGAKTFLRNHFRQTALEMARHDELEDIARLIGSHDDARVALAAEQPLIAAARRGDLRTARALVATGVDLEARTPMIGTLDDDYTALGIAAREGHADVVRLLLAGGADPESCNGLMGGQPLHEAAFMGHVSVIDVLVVQTGLRTSPSAGLDAQGAYNGYTPLHDAVWQGHEPAARALLGGGAGTHVTSHAGETPRQLAVRLGHDASAAVVSDSRVRD